MDDKQIKTNAAPNQREGGEGKRLATPRRAEWVRKTNRRLRWLRGGMVVTIGMLLVLVLLLAVLPAFRVKEIVVEGNTVTSTEEIIAASGIAIGTEIIGTDWSVAMANIEAGCPVRVSKLIYTATKVKITVVELERTYMEYGEVFVSLDEDFTAMRISENEADFEGILKIRLPAIVGITHREAVRFADPAADLSYVSQLLDWLEKAELPAAVSLLNASEKFGVFLVLEDRYRILLGKVGDLDEKMEIAREILATKEGADAFAAVDVSNPLRATYRPVSTYEELLAG